MYISLQGNTLSITAGVRIPGLPPRRAALENVGWSHRSRARLLRRLNTLVADDRLVMFGSYTFHNLVSDAVVAGRYWSVYRKRIVRKGVGGIWVRELQRRGAYHYHAIMLVPPGVSPATLERSWTDVVDPDDDDLRKYGARVSVVDAVAKGVAYIAKYATKSSDTQSGRRWGVFGAVDFARKSVIKLPSDLLPVIRSAVVEHAQNGRSEHYDKSTGVYGCVVYLGHALQDCDWADSPIASAIYAIAQSVMGDDGTSSDIPGSVASLTGSVL